MNNKKNNNNNNSGLPALIIAGVLLAAVVGGWWLYSSSKTNPVANTSNTNKPAVNQTPQSTPMKSTVSGANPPHFKGAPSAPVVIEEFADFQCPTCAVIHTAMNEVTSIYGSRIKFTFRNFPLSQIHPNAYDAAVAAEAAGLQGKFWEMQNLLFQNQQKWSTAPNARALFESYAGTLGIDLEKFKEDMSGMVAKQRVDADMQRGSSLGINSTPTILINNRPVPVEQMNVVGIRQIINAELAQMSGGGNTQTAPAPNKAAETGNSNAGNK